MKIALFIELIYEFIFIQIWQLLMNIPLQSDSKFSSAYMPILHLEHKSIFVLLLPV